MVDREREAIAVLREHEVLATCEQFLGIVPSRYYLELRLQKARQLVQQSNHSIVQVGLICGFSSSSHFSTAYSALFGRAPRDERQKMLARQMA